MRKDIEGIGRKKIFTKKSIGVRKVEKGQRVRKTVAGNTIYEGTAQVNVVMIKKGSEPLFKETDEEKKEVKPEESTEKSKNKEIKNEGSEKEKSEKDIISLILSLPNSEK